MLVNQTGKKPRPAIGELRQSYLRVEWRRCRSSLFELLLLLRIQSRLRMFWCTNRMTKLIEQKTIIVF